jgi:drug/metabolite transporter (DMT)-like permease
MFNILGAAAVLGESLPLSQLPWIGLAFAGALLLAQPTAKNWTLVGVVCALLAAATETGIYLWFKTKSEPNVETFEGKDVDAQPWTKMIQLYGSSGVLWALVAVVLGSLGFLAKGTFRLTAAGLGTIALFNALVGFNGYALRFFLIPRVSTVVYSVLSFFGVVSAYGLGWLFQGEVPTLTQVAGAVAIVIANGALLSKENI